jgi:hypothetical protein
MENCGNKKLNDEIGECINKDEVMSLSSQREENAGNKGFFALKF